MAISPRTLKCIPEHNIIYPPPVPYGTSGSSGPGMSVTPNTLQQVKDFPVLFAYRRTSKGDKRIRLVHTGPNVYQRRTTLFYIEGTKKFTPVVPNSNINIRTMLETPRFLEDYWLDNLHTFSEGKTYAYNKFSIDILSLEEHEALMSSTLFEPLGMSDTDWQIKY
jgi:hypothetical protein